MTLESCTVRKARGWREWPTQPTSCASSMVVASLQNVPSPEPQSWFVSWLVSISYIETGNRRFTLRRALLPCLNREGSLWSCEFDDLHLMGYGSSPQQAIDQFMGDFGVAYDALVNKEDDQLTGDSRELRDALTDLVKQITPLEDEFDVNLQSPQVPAAFGGCLCATR